MSELQSVEGHCKAVCLALHITEAQHIVTDTDERRKELVRLTIKSLQKLLGNKGAAMSLEPTLGAEQDAACDALSRRLGWMPARGA